MTNARGAESGPGAAQLDYRTAAADPSAGVIRQLEADEALGGAVVAGKLGIGIPLCLIGPLIVTWVVLWFAGRWDLRSMPSASTLFFLVSAVVVPLLFWLDHRTRGRFMSEAVHGEENPFRSSSYGEFQLQSTKLEWMAYVEIALTGPRLVREVYDWLTGRPAGNPGLRAVAAGLAVDLLAAGEGRQLRDLAMPGRPPAVVSAGVAYLLARDWVGVSAAGDRVWLLTSTRDRLVAALRGCP